MHHDTPCEEGAAWEGGEKWDRSVMAFFVGRNELFIVVATFFPSCRSQKSSPFRSLCLPSILARRTHWKKRQRGGVLKKVFFFFFGFVYSFFFTPQITQAPLFFCVGAGIVASGYFMGHVMKNHPDVMYVCAFTAYYLLKETKQCWQARPVQVEQRSCQSKHQGT